MSVYFLHNISHSSSFLLIFFSSLIFTNIPPNNSFFFSIAIEIFALLSSIFPLGKKCFSIKLLIPISLFLPKVINFGKCL